MKSIYVIHNNILCVKKSYLKKYFSFNENLLKDFKVIKKGILPNNTDLLEYDSFPRVLRALIIDSFGHYERQRKVFYQHPFALAKYLIIKITALQKELDSLKQ